MDNLSSYIGFEILVCDKLLEGKNYWIYIFVWLIC